MHKIGCIRLLTYVMVVLAFIASHEKRHVLEVSLSDISIYESEEEETLKKQALHDITREPGFETTRLSGSEVIRIAMEKVGGDGGDLESYRPPIITLFRRDGRMLWSVNWVMKGIPAPGGFFSVVVDDETKEAELFPGM
jgi:hypothetical protein